MTKKNIGYIGLGKIGGPTAKHIISDAYKLHVYDVSEEAVKTLTDAGAKACDSVAELAAKCEHIGICVRDDKDVENLLYGGGGILENAKPGTLIAISSTISQAGLEKWGKDVANAKMALIDAPISGGPHGAAAGTLAYMVGGAKEDFERAKPIFETSGSVVVYAGELGGGTTLKLANNLMTYSQFVAISEAFALAEANGVNPELLFEIGASNGVVNQNTQMFISGRRGLFASGGVDMLKQFMGPSAALGEKDLQCALESAEATGIELPLTRLNRDLIKDVFLNKISYKRES